MHHCQHLTQAILLFAPMVTTYTLRMSFMSLLSRTIFYLSLSCVKIITILSVLMTPFSVPWTRRPAQSSSNIQLSVLFILSYCTLSSLPSLFLHQQSLEKSSILVYVIPIMKSSIQWLSIGPFQSSSPLRLPVPITLVALASPLSSHFSNHHTNRRIP